MVSISSVIVFCLQVFFGLLLVVILFPFVGCALRWMRRR